MKLRNTSRLGGAREGAGRPEGVIDVMPRGKSMQLQRWEFAEYAIQHAYEALDTLIKIMRTGESEAARVAASDKILDRALGKAPLHSDITALRHTEIVYRSAEELRKALMAEGVPKALLDLTVESSETHGE